MTPQQCKAARFLLSLTPAELGEKAQVTANTVRSYETGAVRSHAASVERIEAALVKLGVVFLEGTAAGEARPKKVLFEDGSGVELAGWPTATRS